MLYGYVSNDSLIVTAADTLLEYEEFKSSEEHSLPEGAEIGTVDFFALAANPDLQKLKVPPKMFDFGSADRDAVATQLGVIVLNSNEARNRQEEMVETAKLAASVAGPADRRTLGEVHDLFAADPWDNRSDDEKAQGAKMDAHMRKVRDAGGLTGDSFDKVEGDKLDIHGVNVVVDSDGSVLDATVKAGKSSLTPYILIVDGDDLFDFEEVFDEIRMPENRIIEQDGNTVKLRIHDHQIALITEALDKRGATYSLNKDLPETPAGMPDQIAGHDHIKIFFSVQVDHVQLHELSDAIATFDQSRIVAMREIEGGCWYALKSRVQAENLADVIRESGHAVTVVAITRDGKAILGEGTNAHVVDTNEEIVVEPRPWNDRAFEIDAMTEEQRTELYKSIKGNEILFSLEHSDRFGNIIHFVPRSYFLDNNCLYTGPMPIQHLLPSDGTLTVMEPDYKYSCKRMDTERLRIMMNGWGMMESLNFRIFINNMRAEEAVDV